MKFHFGGVFMLPWLAAAQIADPLNPANPAAPVSSVAYRSVFADTPTGVQQEAADWKRANAEVGQFRRGHVDILKWEAQQAPAVKGLPSPAGGHGPHGSQP